MDQTADDPPTGKSDYSFLRQSLSADQRRRLVQRFRLTIPLRKLLIVEYRHVIRRDEVYTVIGFPAGVRDSVLYVEKAGELVIVPVACLLSIKAAVP